VGLSVTQVSITNFRSYRSFLLKPDRSLTVLAGPNAAGKTNLIEAIQLLTAALPCVVFTPDDLRMVKDSAEKRRSALDSLGFQLSPTYARLRAEYDKVLRHRNALLREGAASSSEELEPWTEQLAVVGGALVVHRKRLFDRVAGAMTETYARLADDGELQSTYVPSWARDGVGEAEAPPEEAIRSHLAAKKEAEASRRSTISGPHRDEIVFRIGGRDARVFASQGQQRTIALAWKLAEVDVITQIASQAPILLLDDVMSELDERRRHALTAFVGSVTQTIMTTTNLGYFEEGLLERAKVVALP